MKVNKKIIIIGAVALSGSSFAMMRALHTAASGMQAQEANVSTISNNIANVNTLILLKPAALLDNIYFTTFIAGFYYL